MPADAIARVVRELPSFADENLLVGAESFSDAGVYRLRDDLAIVQSTDFFSPLVDDPFVFGQIAAANSMSDIFAMGGTVRTALNIVCFPDNEADLGILTEILRGGAERIIKAGGVVLGGHSIRDAEIKYGLAVTGVVHPDKILSNQGAQVGDVLILTKALGTGYITTANRAGTCPEEVLESACNSMIQLNDSASQAALDFGAHGVTDITGFGLAGHAYEMAEASGVAIEIHIDALPLLPGALELAKKGNLTRANATNLKYVEKYLMVEDEVDLNGVKSGFLFDPQTSGGLLIAVADDGVDEVVKASAGVVIGRVVEAETGVRLRLRR